MTVSATFRVDIRPYTGYSDPGLPVAAWIAQGGVAGDASGGLIFMNFNFQRDEDAQISELFSLDQMHADTSSSVSRIGLLETRNMDALSQNRPLTDQIWRFQTLGGPTGSGFSAIALIGDPLPFWLGAPNRVEGESGLRVTWLNIDLLLHLVTLQGYMWGPRSVLAEGGPRRPVGGLFN